MRIDEAKAALRFIDWKALLKSEDGTTFPVLVGDLVVLAEKVFSEDKEDRDYDRELQVVVKLNDQFFKKTGWLDVGSSCYGESDNEIEWREIEEVFPKVKTIVTYEFQ